MSSTRSRDEAYGKVRVFSGRLTQPVACEGAEQREKAGWSGSYFLPEENGHGIVVEQAWGSVVLTFNSCSEMVADYNSIQGARSLTLTRLTSLAGAACTP